MNHYRRQEALLPQTDRDEFFNSTIDLFALHLAKFSKLRVRDKVPEERTVLGVP